MSQPTPGQPNILLIHWHDLGRNLSAYGVDVTSPHTQRLADQSVVFDQCFATTPLCSPARGALWTGRYPHSNGLQGLTHRGWDYHEGELTLAHYLADNGYHTALIGHQHEANDPSRIGFAELDLFNPADCEIVADHAARWIADQASRSVISPEGTRPWLLTCGMTEVHRQWPRDRYHPADAAALTVPPHLPDNELTRQDLADFHGAITTADQSVGRILAALEKSGLAEETIVIFTTDHGAPFPRAKSTLYDPGVGVALMIRPPGRWGIPAHRVPGLASHVDIVPTVLDLIGAAVPAPIQGISLAETIRAAAPSPRTEVFLEKTYHSEYDPIRGIRTDTHKYLLNLEPRPLLQLPTDLEASLTRRGMGDAHLAPRPRRELYDLRSDPDEQHNLADSAAHASLREALHDRLWAFLTETRDPILAGPVPNPDPAVTQN